MVAAAARFTFSPPSRLHTPPVGLQSIRSLVPYILARYGVPLEEDRACEESRANATLSAPVELQQQRFDFAR